jgi:hypothetical protein
MKTDVATIPKIVREMKRVPSSRSAQKKSGMFSASPSAPVGSVMPSNPTLA